MAGYAIIHYEIHNRALFAEFLSRVGATIAAHGGRYLVRAGAIKVVDGDPPPDRIAVPELNSTEIEVIDGDWSPDRLIVLEFDSTERARAWLTSPEYTEIKKIRTEATNANVIVVEGV